MLITDARNRLRVDLSDVDETLITDDVLDRAVQRAVEDLSRFLPLESTHEVTLIFAVTDEKWNSAAAAGTYVSLANKPIKYNSETVKNAAEEACVRDTDYYIDYSLGRITHISGGKIGDSEDDCFISYTKSKTTVDLSSLTDLIRVDRVEYPLGDVPQPFVSHDLRGGFLTITGGAESQAAMTEGKHLVISYKAEHTAPTPDVVGSYPLFLDGTVILAASAYALFSVVMKYENQAITDLAAARTAIGSIAAIHILTDTALDAAASALGDATLALGTTKVDDFLSGASAPSSKKYLSDGDDEINEVTVGANVAERYANFAQRCAEIAVTFITKAREHNTSATAYTAEASGRIAEIDRYLGEADRYIGLAMQDMGLADKFRLEAIERRNEAWSIWRDPKQYIGDYTISSVRQPLTR